MSKKYVLLIDGMPCIEDKLIDGYKILGAGTDWECQDVVDGYVESHQSEFTALEVKLDRIRQVVGSDINSGTAPTIKLVTGLLQEVGKELFEKVVVATLLGKAKRESDGRLVSSTCSFIRDLGDKHPEVPKYRVYEHPYLWNEAVQAYMRITEDDK